jgi:sugar lactone lactonase YvrE
MRRFLILLFGYFFFSTLSVQGQTPTTITSVETYAGSSSGSTNGNRLTARFNEPIDMVFDAAGNLYIAEESGSTIRIMDTNGNVSDFVGSSGNTGFVDGTGSTARFFDIRGITLDNAGNIIVADKENHAIRKVTPAGVVTTIAGGSAGFLDGNVSVALFNKPTSVIVDSEGNIFVGDGANNRVRKIDTGGNVSTLIGTGVLSDVDGDLSTASIRSVGSLAFDAQGDLIMSTISGIRRYDFDSGLLSTIVGGDDATTFADGDKNTAGFNAIQTLFIDDENIMYIVDRHALRHIAPDGTVTTLAGSGTQGLVNGAPLSSRFFFPRGIVQNANGDFLIADKASHIIRRLFTNPVANAPVLLASTPEDGAIEFNENEITLTFNENILKGRGAIKIYDASNDQVVRTILLRGPRVSVNDNVATINITRPLYRNKNYYVQIPNTAFRDVDDIFYEGISDKTTLNFSSATRPTLLSSSPADDATEFGGNTIVLNFDREVFKGIGRLRVMDADTDAEITGAGVNSSRVSISGSQVTLDLLNPLPVNKQVYVTIPGSAFKDANDVFFRAILDKTTLNFSTATFSRPMLVSSSPIDEATDFNGTTLTLTFDRNIFAGRGRIRLLDAADDTPITGAGVSSDRITINGNTLTFDLINQLPPSTNVYLKVPSSALKDGDDVFFAGILDKTTLNFSTAAAGSSGSRSESDLTIIQSGDDNKQISVFPNPAKDIITFDLSNLDQPVLLDIIDISGTSKLQQQDLPQSEVSVDLNGYANGLYIVRVLQANGLTITRKFMVRH